MVNSFLKTRLQREGRIYVKQQPLQYFLGNTDMEDTSVTLKNVLPQRQERSIRNFLRNRMERNKDSFLSKNYEKQ